MIARLASGEENALERQIVGLAAAAREHHLARPTAQQRGDISACFFDQRSRGRAAQWPLEGLPKASAKSGRMASTTRGSIGVLAL
jgi:hypothetical protein